MAHESAPKHHQSPDHQRIDALERQYEHLERHFITLQANQAKDRHAMVLLGNVLKELIAEVAKLNAHHHHHGHHHRATLGTTLAPPVPKPSVG